MAIKVKVEFELDIEKITKSALTAQFGAAASGVKIVVPQAAPSRKKPQTRSTPKKASSPKK